MNECPTCGRKIRGDVCPYCEESLEDNGAGDSTAVSGESMVPVCGCENKRDADFILSALEAEGIPAYIETRESLGDLDPDDIIGATDGDLVITVEEEDADRAIDIAQSAQDELDAGEH